MLITQLLRSRLALLAVFAVLCGCTYWAVEKMSQPPFRSPDILVIGDSQISYGAGKVYLDFFDNISARCAANPRHAATVAKLQNMSVAAIGVRSSSLNTWVNAGETDKAMVCEVDKKHGVNAGVYGMSNQRGRRYVQIGKGAEYQFCKPGKSPFQAMFNEAYYAPKLLMIAFLGNSAERWAASKNKALDDVKRAMQQIPKGTPCVFMTTAPSYDGEINTLRQTAQANIKEAFERVGKRCSFVEGITPQTRAANTGNAAFFRQNDEGIVTDPLHPNIKAAETFFEIKTPDICRALSEQVRG